MDSWFDTDAEKFNNSNDWWNGHYYGDHKPVDTDWLGNKIHADGSKSYYCPFNGRRYTQGWGGWWS